MGLWTRNSRMASVAAAGSGTAGPASTHQRAVSGVSGATWSLLAGCVMASAPSAAQAGGQVLERLDGPVLAVGGGLTQLVEQIAVLIPGRGVAEEDA
ncbi:hypothetical protein D3C72_1077330 [compost metagenome]